LCNSTIVLIRQRGSEGGRVTQVSVLCLCVFKQTPPFCAQVLIRQRGSEGGCGIKVSVLCLCVYKHTPPFCARVLIRWRGFEGGCVTQVSVPVVLCEQADAFILCKSTHTAARL